MDARPLPRPKRPVNPLVRAKWLWRILVSCVFTGYYLGYYVFVQQWSDVWTTQEGFFLFFFPVTLSLVGYYCYLKTHSKYGAYPLPEIPSVQSPEHKDENPHHCSICNNGKPIRTHHCRICEKCVLKMDHHCPWVGNCIGHANHKPFVLFLVYIELGMAFVFIAVAVRLFLVFSLPTEEMRQKEFPMEHLFYTVAMVALLFPLFATISSLLFFQLLVVGRGSTTIEVTALGKMMKDKNVKKPIQNPYPFDLGYWGNFYNLMGQSMWSWFLPTPTESDGVHWELTPGYEKRHGSYAV